jgi:tetratricopeptide (TPR) repeat protein
MEIFGKGKPVDAVEKWKKVNTHYMPLDLQTGTPVSFYKSMALFRNGDYTGELSELQLAQKLNPSHPLVGNNLAVALIRNGKTESAYAQLCETLKFHPDFPVAAENAFCLWVKYREGKGGSTGEPLNWLHGAFPEHEKEKETELRKRMEENEFPFRGFYYDGIRGVLD